MGKTHMGFTMLYTKFVEKVQWITVQSHGVHLTSMKVREALTMIQEEVH
jgi:hypothetical protein